MEMRVEQLSVRCGLSVDTIRYYQSKGLLDPPRREGRLAWYNDGHRHRLERVRALQHRGFTLATIARLVSGDLDAADEALLGELSGLNPHHDGSESGGSRPGTSTPRPDEVFTLGELADATGVPLALLKAIEAEGLLIPRRVGTQERYTGEDVAASKAGLLLLEWGIPLSALLALARRHHEATEAVAGEAVALFSTYVRRPHRRGRTSPVDEDASDAEDGDVDRLVRAYSELLPAVVTLVGNHFTRTLVNAALEHVDQVGTEAEREAVGDRIGLPLTAGLAGQIRSDPVPFP